MHSKLRMADRVESSERALLELGLASDQKCAFMSLLELDSIVILPVSCLSEQACHFFFLIEHELVLQLLVG